MDGNELGTAYVMHQSALSHDQKDGILGLPGIWKLYFSDAPIESSKKISFGQDLDQRFCIGPHCSPAFWNQYPGEPELYGGPSPNCGPWDTLTNYCTGLIETGTSRLPKQEDTINPKRPYQGSIQEHIDLLRSSQEVMQKLINDKRIQDAAFPVLLHADFHKKNIYVSAEDPTLITGIIDWQSTSIEPAFLHKKRTPDFAALPAPPNEETLEQEAQYSSQAQRDLKDAHICNQTYDVVMTALTPKLRASRLLDLALFTVFHYCYTTWTDSAVMIRQVLIELSARWKELELDGSCPYSPTREELGKHKQDLEDFEVHQRLMFWLMANMNTNSGGWVPNEDWENALGANRAAYNTWIEMARESEAEGELSVEKADILWPFDAR
ncbi:hypothetical protein N7465_002772 [Penicillium sp. CMV-2018d]|nr:hypothetical protein N7465_002772 [Penicillium sp. CMV-2018d]